MAKREGCLKGFNLILIFLLLWLILGLAKVIGASFSENNDDYGSCLGSYWISKQETPFSTIETEFRLFDSGGRLIGLDGVVRG